MNIGWAGKIWFRWRGDGMVPKGGEAGGDRAAMEQIGKMYEYGEGMATNEAEAVKCYSKAAEKGNKDAKAALQALQDRQKTRKEQARKVPATDEA